ncbi:hypothetical protein [Arthrobacter sp. NPDC057013]|uniref:hypothetical protein n=1 Tax=Arthrobacter sp. NPDC057013 TaxID=3345999 RepID=UPI003639974F
MIAAAVRAGVVLPEALLFTGWFRIMAAFVAVNTVMYAALAVAKVLPKVQPPDLGRGQRSETRGICPEGHEGPGHAGPGHAEESREQVGAGSREP